MKRLALALIGAILVPAAAAAQSEGRFQTGLVNWTPRLVLRDAGVDTNLYDEATDPKRDTSAVFIPQVIGAARLAAGDLRFGGSLGFVYFHRYSTERAVNRDANVRMDFRGSRVRPFVRGAFLDARERTNSEVDIRARRSGRSGGAGVGVRLTPRGALEVGASLDRMTYRQGEIFRGVDLAERMNRESVGADLRFLYKVTPLTRFVAEGTGARDRFTRSPQYDTNNLRIRGGFEFDPAAVLDGRVTVGFHRIEPVGAMAAGFEGLTAGVELRYVLLQRTRFDVRFSRDTSYSMEAQPYFLETTYGGEIRHNVAGPIDVIARAARETLDYPGIPERRITADLLEVNRYGGGVAFQSGQHLQLTVNYEFTKRDSQTIVERRFERHRLYTNVTYGF